MKKLALVLASVMAFGVSVRATTITGTATITSGVGYLNDVGATFFVYGPGLSLSSSTPSWVYLVDAQSILGGLPYVGDKFSYSDSIPAFENAGFWTNCDPGQSDGTYGGTRAYCLTGALDFSSSDMTFSIQRVLASFSSVGGVDTIVYQDVLEATGPFVASGSVQGWGPAYCNAGTDYQTLSENSACSELFDLTLTGQGTMTIIGNGYFFEGAQLTFDDAPEPPTGLLFLGGLLIASGLAIRKKLTIAVN